MPAAAHGGIYKPCFRYVRFCSLCYTALHCRYSGWRAVEAVPNIENLNLESTARTRRSGLRDLSFFWPLHPAALALEQSVGQSAQHLGRSKLPHHDKADL